MRLINKETLWKDVIRSIEYCEDFLGIIDRQKDVDAVPREKYDRLKENAEILSKACAEKEYVVRCKDCVYQIMRWNGVKCCEAHGDHIGADYDFCSKAVRRTDER